MSRSVERMDPYGDLSEPAWVVRPPARRGHDGTGPQRDDGPEEAESEDPARAVERMLRAERARARAAVRRSREG